MIANQRKGQMFQRDREKHHANLVPILSGQEDIC